MASNEEKQTVQSNLEVNNNDISINESVKAIDELKLKQSNAKEEEELERRRRFDEALKCPVHEQPSEEYPRYQLRPDQDMKLEDIWAATQRIRNKLIELNAENPKRFSQKQLERAKTCDFEVRRFLFQADLNEEEALEMLIKKMEYGMRLDYDNAHDLRFPREFYQIGGIFEYAQDANGAPLLYFRGKLHKKLAVLTDAVKKFVLYQMIRIDLRFDQERKWAIVFDMTDTGYSNVDIDLMLFLVKAVRFYFPWSIRYIAVVDLPWYLRGVWKAFDKCLPDNGRRLIVLMDRKRLQHIVPKENLPDFMGGTCKIDYCAVPEGAESAEVIGAKELGLSSDQVKELKCHFKAFLPKDIKV